MPIQIDCACGKRLIAPDTAAGKKAKCPGCGAIVTIPSAASPPPEPDFRIVSESAPGEAPPPEDEAARPGPVRRPLVRGAGVVGGRPSRIPRPQPKSRAAALAIVGAFVVVALGVVAYIAFFGGSAYPWEPFVRKQRTPSGQPWTPPVKRNVGDVIRLELTQNVKVHATAEGKSETQDMSSRIETASQVLEVDPDGTARLRVELTKESTSKYGDRSGPSVFEMRQKADGTLVPGSIKGIEGDTSFMDNNPLKDMTMFTPPRRGLRVGEAIDIKEAMNAEEIQRAFGASGAGIKPSFEGEMALEGFEAYHGKPCAKYSIDAEIRMDASSSQGGGDMKMKMGIRMQGHSFVHKDLGYQVGGEIRMQFVMDMKATMMGKKIAVKGDGVGTLIMSGSFTPGSGK